MFDYYAFTTREEMEREAQRDCGPEGKLGTHHLTCGCTQLRLRDYVEALEAERDKLREALEGLMAQYADLLENTLGVCASEECEVYAVAHAALAAGEGE